MISDSLTPLAHFVPFAIFVSVVSLLVILVLYVRNFTGKCFSSYFNLLTILNHHRIVSTIFKQKSPISTRIELACLGLLGVLWLALGSFLAASAAAEADVECFSSSSTLEDPVELPGCTYMCY